MEKKKKKKKKKKRILEYLQQLWDKVLEKKAILLEEAEYYGNHLSQRTNDLTNE